MTNIDDILQNAAEKLASDIFIGVGRCISYKLNGIITPQTAQILDEDEVEAHISDLYAMANRTMTKFFETGDDDFTLSIQGLARFRVCTYRQRGMLAAVIRVVMFYIPDFRVLNIPDGVMKVAQEQHGLVLITGAAGNGKSTTLACIIDVINKTRNCHIITLEDPIEFLHRDVKSIISQREISLDTSSYVTALRASLRQAPDILLLGEMRDYETIKSAVTAAETGHLVISTLHTVGAVNTIDRIIDVFPPEQQEQIRVQLSMLLKTVISQQLLPNKEGKLVPAYEIMHVNEAIRNLIREGKTHQINTVIQTSSKEGMIGMDSAIYGLFQSGSITPETAVSFSANAAQMSRRIGL